ncbi:DUF2064 domain-containing protein [Actinoplanes sp. TFC3]|uniref:DUF2064 domain-containing protein n=1 Tax=Actinoplanes sp. TFC3 TaxID=1710355 RepID=UPI000834F5C6|nr:DUF2064 domain-containing protein [Actinoplanes sp. TFC3]
MTRSFRCATVPGVHRHRDFLLLTAPTPELTPQLRRDAYDLLRTFDVVIGATTDGGWYAFGLREPAFADDLDTGAGSSSLTLAALRLGLRVALLPTLPAVP